MSRILIIPAPIRSHILPSLYLGELFQNKNEIFYASLDGEFSELIKKNGFKFILLNTDRFASGFDPLNVYNLKGGKLSLRFFISTIHNYINKVTYKNRKDSLIKIIDEIQPSLVLIDIFSSTDFLILKPIYNHLQIVFFNPMLNTFDLTVTEKKKRSLGDFIKGKNKFKQIRNALLIKAFARITGFDPKPQLKWIINSNPILKDFPILKGNKYVRLFQNIPELILAPIELEFSQKIKRENQFYLGLSLVSNRVDTMLDDKFANEFSKIIEHKNTFQCKLIYCSFGSYFSSLDEHKFITSFCLILMKAFYEYKKYIFVISVNEKIQEHIFKYLQPANNFFFFSRVNQLDVLRYSDCFISHGGLGSIKEAIKMKVPVLAYPLDYKWDQPDNAHKIVFHKLGQMGDLRNDDKTLILKRLQDLISTNEFKSNIERFCDKINSRYTSRKLKDELNFFFKLHNIKVNLD
jgi:hypothetical protein